MVLCQTIPAASSSGSPDTSFSESLLLKENASLLAQLGKQQGVPLLADLPFLDALSHGSRQPNKHTQQQSAQAQEEAWNTLSHLLLPAARILMESLPAVDQTAPFAERIPHPQKIFHAPMNNSVESLADFDRKHLWHPYTSALDPLLVYEVTGAEGTTIHLRNGQKLVDGMSSWWCAIHGYRHPVLVQALREQTERLSHIMFGGLTHEPAVRLGRKLLSLLPPGLDHLFFADSGSVAIEVAIKMALQYWKALGQDNKTRIVALRGGYHGDTLGAMSVCDPVTGMHSLFAGFLPVQLFVERPACRFDMPFTPSSLHPMQELLHREHRHIAAVIVEPIVQGAGGMWFYHPEYLSCLRQLCDELNILLIADEIATDFRRTGKLFASEWSHISPDILCLGKALTGGMMTLSATAASHRVAVGISSPSSAGNGVFMHGPTFMGNPLACAVACASMNLLMDSPWQNRIQCIEKTLTQHLSPCLELPDVVDVRTLGAIGVVEMNFPVNIVKLQDFL